MAQAWLGDARALKIAVRAFLRAAGLLGMAVLLFRNGNLLFAQARLGIARPHGRSICLSLAFALARAPAVALVLAPALASAFAHFLARTLAAASAAATTTAVAAVAAGGGGGAAAAAAVRSTRHQVAVKEFYTCTCCASHLPPQHDAASPLGILARTF